jgi:hypothetical protein
MNRIVFALGLLIVVFVIYTIGKGAAQSKSGTQTPVITHSYALDKGAYGQTWKIYIAAEDPDGDMLKIGCKLEQERVRYQHPVDFIFIKKKDQRQLKGYLSLDTYFLREPFLEAGPRLVLRVSVYDKAGNESKEAVFNFDFVGTETGSGTRLPPPFDQGDIPKLGNILIEGKYPPPPSP